MDFMDFLNKRKLIEKIRKLKENLENSQVFRDKRYPCRFPLLSPSVHLQQFETLKIQIPTNLINYKTEKASHNPIKYVKYKNGY